MNVSFMHVTDNKRSGVLPLINMNSIETQVTAALSVTASDAVHTCSTN